MCRQRGIVASTAVNNILAQVPMTAPICTYQEPPLSVCTKNPPFRYVPRSPPFGMYRKLAFSDEHASDRKEAIRYVPSVGGQGSLCMVSVTTALDKSSVDGRRITFASATQPSNCICHCNSGWASPVPQVKPQITPRMPSGYLRTFQQISKPQGGPQTIRGSTRIR